MRAAWLAIVFAASLAHADSAEERVAFAAGLQGGFRDHGGRGEVHADGWEHRTLAFAGTGQCSDGFLDKILAALKADRLRVVGFRIVACVDAPAPLHAAAIP